MAGFCKQCCDELFCEDLGDFAGLVSGIDYMDGKVAIVICEGCGLIAVDPEGSRVEKLGDNVSGRA